jgi:hypothetical protein
VADRQDFPARHENKKIKNIARKKKQEKFLKKKKKV